MSIFQTIEEALEQEEAQETKSEKLSGDSTKINNVKDLHNELKKQVMESKQANADFYDNIYSKYTSLFMSLVFL